MNVGDVYDIDPAEKAELMGMAESFFVSEIEPLHRESGVPEDAIAYLKREYCKAVIVNPDAVRQIREYLNIAPDRNSALATPATDAVLGDGLEGDDE